VAQKYEGSKEYELSGVPLLVSFFSATGKSDGFFTVRGADDARIRLLQYNGFKAGILGGINFGRNDSDGRLLRGFGDIDAGLVAGAVVGYRFGASMIHASYHEIIGDYSAGYVRFGIDTILRHAYLLNSGIRDIVTSIQQVTCKMPVWFNPVSPP
jgi:outer membrane protein